jgi:pimeloyl-ACP methyl ester carboxylesterase
MGRRKPGALPVVMLHGAVTGSMASWWMTSAPHVAAANQVVLYDLRGHGLSHRPATGYRMRDHLDDLARVTEGLGSFALVGHSLGGWIAVEAARAWPQRVAALVCVDIPIGDKRPRLETEPPTTSDRRRHSIPLSATSFRDDLAAEPPLDAVALASLRCPALLAFGRQSPFASGAAVARAALGDEAVRTFDGGHALHLDATDAVTDAIVRFLARVAGAPEARHG